MDWLVAPRWMLQRLRNRLRAWQWLALQSRKPIHAGSAVTGITFECPTCHNARCEAFLQVEKTTAEPLQRSDYHLAWCAGCDAVYLQPAPSAADLHTLYEEAAQFTDPAYSGAAQSARIVDYYARRLQVLKLVPAAGESMLEIGAGLAWVAQACKRQDPAIRTVAQDVSHECATRCPWVDDYTVGSIDSLPTQARFALASMTHVIEHLVDPAGMLGAVSARLQPGGRLYITAPYRPPLWKPGDRAEAWLAYSYLHVPAHISYLSRRWFEHYCEQHRELELLHWDDTHDGHQAFEVVLGKRLP